MRPQKVSRKPWVIPNRASWRWLLTNRRPRLAGDWPDGYVPEKVDWSDAIHGVWLRTRFGFWLWNAYHHAITFGYPDCGCRDYRWKKNRKGRPMNWLTAGDCKNATHGLLRSMVDLRDEVVAKGDNPELVKQIEAQLAEFVGKEI